MRARRSEVAIDPEGNLVGVWRNNAAPDRIRAELGDGRPSTLTSFTVPIATLRTGENGTFEAAASPDFARRRADADDRLRRRHERDRFPRDPRVREPRHLHGDRHGERLVRATDGHAHGDRDRPAHRDPGAAARRRPRPRTTRPDSDIAAIGRRVRRRRMRAIRGTASDQLGVARVEIALMRLKGGARFVATTAAKRCLSLRTSGSDPAPARPLRRADVPARDRHDVLELPAQAPPAARRIRRRRPRPGDRQRDRGRLQRGGQEPAAVPRHPLEVRAHAARRRRRRDLHRRGARRRRPRSSRRRRRRRPDDQSEGVLDAVDAALERGRAASAGDVEAFAHGMTVATNALLEGEGARTALVATEGFTDVVELGRQARKDLYRLCARAPGAARPARAPRRRARARTGRDGVHRAARRRRRARGRRTTSPSSSPRPSPSACCTPTASPSTSARSARTCARALPDVHVSLSHEVVGTFREFERAATTEVDAALSPLLAALPAPAGRARASEEGLPAPSIMQSSGGLADVELAAAPRRAHRAERPGGRRGRRGADRRAVRHARPALLRHGRHVVRRLRRRGRPRPRDRRPRGRRAAARAADGRHPHGRRRRRLDRLARPGRRAARRAALGGRRPRARLLRPRRHRADGHRREPRARPARPRRRRWPAASTLDVEAARARGRVARPRPRARAPRGHRPRRQRRDGPRAARHDRRARRRPARLRAARVRRRGRAARVRRSPTSSASAAIARARARAACSARSASPPPTGASTCSARCSAATHDVDALGDEARERLGDDGRRDRGRLRLPLPRPVVRADRRRPRATSPRAHEERYGFTRGRRRGRGRHRPRDRARRRARGRARGAGRRARARDARDRARRRDRRSSAASCRRARGSRARRCCGCPRRRSRCPRAGAARSTTWGR